MTDVEQQLQQKPESATDARTEFERGLEELMRGHLDDCMSFASCSSPRNTENEDDEGDQLVRRRRRSDLEEDDLTRVFCCPEAPLADSEQGNVERLSTRASSILQMWRELEDEHLLNHARERVRERLRQQTSVELDTNASSMDMSEIRERENQGSVEEANESENNFGTWSHDQMGTQNEHRDPDSSSREQSPDLGEVERERVRQIARGWMESGITDRSSNVVQRSSHPRAEWLGETERERVRIVREWVQMTSQQRGSRGSRRDEQVAGPSPQVDQVREGLAAEHDEGQQEHVRRDMLRLRGRQALIDLLVRVERERQRELQGLLEPSGCF
ncbi:RING/U-box superfamily protein [Actinidia rufa]|uniref:RING/U-box superfamily protein n=1 Tax=Actinidia rufa TaxID=165716 RepID=A0A7J0G555_9ERIC|nr:RING/U-box superfamily protein [Actinidia rufa]